MRTIQVGARSLEPDDNVSATILGFSPRLFAAVIGGRASPTEEPLFSKTFPNVTQVRWTRGASDLWAAPGDGLFICYPRYIQPYLLRSIGPVASLHSLQVSFEEDLILDESHSACLVSSYANLTSLTLSGEICHLILCLRALPS